MTKRAAPGETALRRVTTQYRSQKAFKALVEKRDATPSSVPPLVSTLARYRGDGLLEPSRKGAR